MEMTAFVEWLKKEVVRDYMDLKGLLAIELSLREAPNPRILKVLEEAFGMSALLIWLA